MKKADKTVAALQTVIGAALSPESVAPSFTNATLSKAVDGAATNPIPAYKSLLIR
jgi:hypothetical protein